ncbi:phage major capsid protein [Tengunoibacter tsumagoiensis]|uniref:Uncharacterized protein n=1 Tax=Tengunoibacter tsumagoiensis TaxID=2014871 RepID=A0A402A2D7_9CHLR|nr:Mu-like prophage major head subunit gpT family protein [Tengunoibacter tsumagoiensis]GCE13307.1 hypothetical protein KTT_31660 [Tengunoibacter tsumagoiensis]
MPEQSSTTIRLDGEIQEHHALSPQGHAVRVTVLQGGLSKNGYNYNECILQEIACCLEGAHAYTDHVRPEAAHDARSVRDIVGFYQDALYVAGTPEQPGRVEATLHILEAAEWLWSLIQEACRLEQPELIGLSIDIFGRWQLNEATRAKDVIQVIALNSCDVVTRPSAGGRFQRILHHDAPLSSYLPSTSQGDHLMDVTSASSPLPSSSAQVQEHQSSLTPQLAEITELKRELQLERAQILLERRLLESALPEAVQKLVRDRYTNRFFEQHELDAELQAQHSMLSALSSSGLIRGHTYEKPDISHVISEAEKIQAAFDRMFDLEVDTGRLGPIRPFGSIREAYARVTGDPAVAGFTERSTLGTIRVSESAPIAHISEADTTTASFSYLLGTSMNKRLLKDYQAWPAEWMKFTTIVPIRDFKQQTRVRLGAFGSLSIVAEDSSYSTMTLTDSAATYVPQKRGNLVTVSREVIVNDDLQAIKQIPTKLAVSAAYTLAEFVYGFLSSNSTIYDGSALFTTGAPHNNLGAAALSTSAMQTGVTAMREQTNYAGKRLGLRPHFLVVPPELEWSSMIVTKSAGMPGGNANDINPMLGYVTPIVSPQLSNSSQWFLIADPREVDTIEIGFVGGQVNPALFIQDQPLFGLNFTQDVITYKIRHEFGGAVVDYRGMYRGI